MVSGRSKITAVKPMTPNMWNSISKSPFSKGPFEAKNLNRPHVEITSIFMFLSYHPIILIKYG